MNYQDVKLVSALGDVVPLAACTLICVRAGENDYSDPIGFMWPLDDTPIRFGDVPAMLGPNGEKVDPDEIDWGEEDD